MRRDTIDRVIKVRFSNINAKCSCLAKQDEHGICYLNTSANIHIIVKGSDEYKKSLIEECDEVKGLIKVVDNIKEEIISLIKEI